MPLEKLTDPDPRHPRERIRIRIMKNDTDPSGSGSATLLTCLLNRKLDSGEDPDPALDIKLMAKPHSDRKNTV